MALLAAGAHVIVVRQVNIKDELALHWREHALPAQACSASLGSINDLRRGAARPHADLIWLKPDGQLQTMQSRMPACTACTAREHAKHLGVLSSPEYALRRWGSTLYTGPMSILAGSLACIARAMSSLSWGHHECLDAV